MLIRVKTGIACLALPRMQDLARLWVERAAIIRRKKKALNRGDARKDNWNWWHFYSVLCMELELAIHGHG